MSTPTTCPRGALAPLATGADVWVLREADVARFAEALGGDEILAAEELQRRDRLRQEGARVRFFGARLLSRVALSRYVDVPPSAWRFRKGQYGRPEIEGESHGLDFNITHTDGMIAVVVARWRRCGLDVERRPCRPEAVRLIKKVLAPPELAFVRMCPGELRRRIFADLWVAKEAYTKALGMGLSRPFNTFGTRRKDDGTLELVDPTIPPEEQARWQMEVFHLADGITAGVALSRINDETGRIPLRIFDALAELLP
ncbi:MAG TPA: 4'-phosphopantetheinyl transferase superfamily protein [Mycobacteriales bacterium]|nr:4'-phosphopantetheinyl transferase superfamily protein [Mycobacteriales bacterium]